MEAYTVAKDFLSSVDPSIPFSFDNLSALD
jgi:hypothetical protein